jgi:hypothetical protein
MVISWHERLSAWAAGLAWLSLCLAAGAYGLSRAFIERPHLIAATLPLYLVLWIVALLGGQRLLSVVRRRVFLRFRDLRHTQIELPYTQNYWEVRIWKYNPATETSAASAVPLQN